MQSCLQKIKIFGPSSRAGDVSLQLSIDHVEKLRKHCRKSHFEVFEKETEIEGKIKCLEKSTILFDLVLKDANDRSREYFYNVMVENIAQNVAELLVNQPIDYDELRVALCIFEKYCEKIDIYNHKIIQLRLSIRHEPHKYNEYENTREEISILEID